LVSYIRELGSERTVATHGPNLESGQAVFEQICAKCHGVNGGTTTSVGKAVKAKDLRDPSVQNLTDSEMYEQIAGGTVNMPPFEGTYRKEQIDNVIAYVRKLGKAYADIKKSS
jgi:mono/diheme cytochrome c family protein